MAQLPDLVELSGLASNTTYGYSGANQILGVVDDATYTGDDDNSGGQVIELNDTASDGGILTIGGVAYTIDLAVPDGSSDDVTVFLGTSGSSVDLSGNGFRSEVAFITATPVGGGPVRYFMVIDDSIGDLANISQVQTRDLDFSPAGNDVRITASGNQDVGVVCFARGTRIAVPGGARRVETLGAGDVVLTADDGAQPLCWVGRQRIGGARLKRGAALRPVRIEADALGPGCPDAPLLVSPQHRILVASPIVARMFGVPELLVPAIKLVGLPGISQCGDVHEIE